MKAQLIFFLIVIGCFTVKGAVIVDLDSLLTGQEIREIKLQCEKIQQIHKVNLFVYLYSNEEDKPELIKVPRGPNRLAQVFINRRDTKVSVHTVNLDALNKRFIQNVFFQFLEIPMKEGTSLVSHLMRTLDEIEQELERQRVESENRKLEDLTEKEFDPRGSQIIRYLIGFFLAFIILLIIKGAKTGNNFEALEFYGLSRLPMWLSIPLGILAFLYGSFLILQHIGNGAWIVVMCYIFAFYPIMVVISGIIKGVQDGFELQNHTIEKPHLSLGQQLWLARFNTSTEHLMEVNFYGLIIKQIIHLDIETHEKHRRIITEYFITPGSAFNPKASFTPDELVFINELYQEPEALRPFLHRVYNRSDASKPIERITY